MMDKLQKRIYQKGEAVLQVYDDEKCLECPKYDLCKKLREKALEMRSKKEKSK